MEAEEPDKLHAQTIFDHYDLEHQLRLIKEINLN